MMRFRRRRARARVRSLWDRGSVVLNSNTPTTAFGTTLYDPTVFQNVPQDQTWTLKRVVLNGSFQMHSNDPLTVQGCGFLHCGIYLVDKNLAVVDPSGLAAPFNNIDWMDMWSMPFSLDGQTPAWIVPGMVANGLGVAQGFSVPLVRNVKVSRRVNSEEIIAFSARLVVASGVISFTTLNDGVRFQGTVSNLYHSRASAF